MDKIRKIKTLPADNLHISPLKFKFAAAFAGAAIMLCAARAVSAPNTPRMENRPVLSGPTQAQPPQRFHIRVPDTPRIGFDGGTFGLENSSDGPVLVFEKDGGRRTVRLSLPSAEVLGEARSVHLGEGWSFIMAENVRTGEHHAIITMGAADVAAGRQTLPGNDFLNADCILLPEPPSSHSFAEDKIFLLYPGGVIRVIDSGAGSMRRLRIEGASENSVAVRFEGLYFLLQPNATPVVILREDGSSWEAQAFDYDSSELSSLQGHSAGPSGLSVRFLNSLGQEVEMQVTVGEEGNLETVDVEVR